MPTNSPILPFLVLTMAGGCGVSNLMKRAGNNSWVCVQTGLEGGGREREVRRGEGRLSQDTGVLVKTRARERERELHWPQQRAQNGCQSKLQKKKRLSERESLPSLRSGWLVWAHARSLRGRPDSNQLGRAGMGSRVELWVSEAPQFVTAGFEGWTGGVGKSARQVWHQISLDSEPFTYFLMFSSQCARSLYLIGWED